MARRASYNWLFDVPTAMARQAIAASAPDLVSFVANLLTPFLGAVLLPAAITVGLFFVSWQLGVAAAITLPLLLPIIAATFVVRWLGAVKMFDIALAATYGGPGGATNVINLFIYEEAFRSLRFAESAAMAVIVLVLTMILTGLFLRGTRKLEEIH